MSIWENTAQFLNCVGGWRRLDAKYLNPLWVDIYQKHLSVDWTHIVEMKAGLGASWPFSGVQGSGRRYRLTGLAVMTGLNQVFYLSVHPWPPHIHPCQVLHPGHTRVALCCKMAFWPWRGMTTLEFHRMQPPCTDNSDLRLASAARSVDTVLASPAWHPEELLIRMGHIWSMHGYAPQSLETHSDDPSKVPTQEGSVAMLGPPARATYWGYQHCHEPQSCKTPRCTRWPTRKETSNRCELRPVVMWIFFH